MPDRYQAAADAVLIKNWRCAHCPSLAKTRAGLGMVVARVLNRDSSVGLVTQRLKCYESIVATLVRDQTRLAEIEDIAGCRSVLPGLRAVRAVHGQLVEQAGKLELVRVRDYNESPHRGGYRAVHLWCRRDGFTVEIQLRTSRQQDWANAVEEWDRLLDVDIKHERAPEELLSFFRELANYYWQLDCGVTRFDLDVAGLRSARRALEPWLTRQA